MLPITPMNKIRPGCDYRGGGRSSARETAMRVAAGRLPKYLAEKFGIEIRGCLTQMGDIPLEIKDWSQVEQNPFFCPTGQNRRVR